MGRPIELEYKKVGPGKWQKWNALLCILSTIEAEYENGKLVRYHYRREQPKWFTDAVLDRNVAMQNDGKQRFGADLITQTASLPIAVHAQIMEKCGFKAGQGYDEKRFRQIMNDRDYYKLKTVSGRL